MSTSLTAFPLCWPAGWPRTQAGSRARAKFSTKDWRSTPNGSYAITRVVSIAEATKRVLAELKTMGAREDVLISSNLKLRLDGLPKSDQAEPVDVGVCVYWRDLRNDDAPPRCMAIDLYETTAGNLAAIAATLSALRAIERHGGAQILDRAFAGFVALPGPGTRTCWEILGMVEGGDDATYQSITESYRVRARNAHPDTGGSNERMAELNAARDEALRKAGVA